MLSACVGAASCGRSSPPSTRTIHSFYYGVPTSILCPGSTLNDGVCDSEFLWDATFCATTAVQPTSWGSVKALYR